MTLMKYLVIKKRIVNFEPVDKLNHYSSFASDFLVQKKKILVLLFHDPTNWIAKVPTLTNLDGRTIDTIFLKIGRIHKRQH